MQVYVLVRSGVTDRMQRLASWTDYFAFYDAKSPARAYDRSYPWFYAIVLVVSILILFARIPEMVLDPRFFAEDGQIFYQDAYNLGPLTSIIVPYAGYYHLLPRMIASISLALPIASAPLFFGLTSLLITGVSMSWFFLPHFRPFVANDWIRLGVVALCLTSPNLEGLMVIAYMQWYVATWSVFVALMKPPQRLWIQWSIALGYVVATASAPVVVLLTPLWLLRLYHAQPKQRLWIGCILLAQAIVIWASLRASPGMPNLFPIDLLMLDLWRAFAYKIVNVTLVGHLGAEWLLHWLGWWGIYLVAGLVCMGIVLIGVQRRGEPKQLFLSLLLGYIVLATTLLYAHRASDYGFVFALGTDAVVRGHTRYFYLAAMALYLFFALHADYLMQVKRTFGVRSTLMGCLVVILIGYGLTFHIPYLGISNWQQYGSWLTTLLKEPHTNLSGVIITLNDTELEGNRQGEDGFQLFLPVVTTSNPKIARLFGVSVPIVPQPWCMTLHHTAKPRTTVPFADGITLLSVDISTQQDDLLLEFLWTTSSVLEGKNPLLTFEIVDGENQTILVRPEPLVVPEGEHCYPRLFASKHLITLPQDIDSGAYDLLLSLSILDHPTTITPITARFPGLVQLHR